MWPRNSKDFIGREIWVCWGYRMTGPHSGLARGEKLDRMSVWLNFCERFVKMAAGYGRGNTKSVKSTKLCLPLFISEKSSRYEENARREKVLSGHEVSIFIFVFFLSSLWLWNNLKSTTSEQLSYLNCVGMCHWMGWKNASESFTLKWSFADNFWGYSVEVNCKR